MQSVLPDQEFIKMDWRILSALDPPQLDLHHGLWSAEQLATMIANCDLHKEFVRLNL